MPFDATDYALPDAPTPPTTPRERIAYLRDFLRTLPDERFDIGCDGGDTSRPTLAPECNTPVCVAGWACRLFFGQDISNNPQTAGRKLLGLPYLQSSDLFCPEGWSCHPHLYTRLRAIRVLDIYLSEGVIDWPRAIAEVPDGPCDQEHS